MRGIGELGERRLRNRDPDSSGDPVVAQRGNHAQRPLEAGALRLVRHGDSHRIPVGAPERVQQDDRLCVAVFLILPHHQLAVVR